MSEIRECAICGDALLYNEETYCWHCEYMIRVDEL